MITDIVIRDRETLAGGAEFGASGAYTRLNGTAFGELDPAHPGIAALRCWTSRRATHTGG